MLGFLRGAEMSRLRIGGISSAELRGGSVIGGLFFFFFFFNGNLKGLVGFPAQRLVAFFFPTPFPCIRPMAKGGKSFLAAASFC